MPNYHNFYECPECNHCWDHEDDNKPQDDCPECLLPDIDPVESFPND